MKYEVYKIQNKLNNKLYIGITNKGYKRRFKKHCSEMRNGSTFILHNAMRKYGIENFEVTLLETVETVDKLKERETFWITTLDTINRDKGYNMTLGGDGTFGRLHSQETKDKISKKAEGRISSKRIKIVIEDLTNKEIIEFDSILEANKYLNKGNSFITYYRNKYGNEFLIDTYKITCIKLEYIPKQKENKIYNPEEHLLKMRELALKARSENFEEYQEAQKQAKLETGKTKLILQYTLEGEFIAEYMGTREAAKAVNGQRSPIKNCLKGKTLKSYGYIWKYK